jgi:hypothetical protein
MKSKSNLAWFFSFVVLLFFGCSNSQNAIEDEIEDEILVEDIFQDLTVVNLTKSEAESRIRIFLKENAKKYADYGEVEGISLISGYYTHDEALDYFYTVNFYPGGDFIYPTHFFYDSQQDKVRELKMSKTIEFVNSIDVKEVLRGKLVGEASVWGALSGEHMASRSVKAEFVIEDNKINCEKKFMPALNKANKEVEKELEQIEAEWSEHFD